MAWYWTIWLFFGLPLSFGLAEAYAIWKGKQTLSQYVWELSKVFPPFPFIAGFLAGFLACHFWWGGAVCFLGCTP